MDCPSSFNEVLKTDKLIPISDSSKTSSDGPSCEHIESDHKGEEEQNDMQSFSNWTAYTDGLC